MTSTLAPAIPLPASDDFIRRLTARDEAAFDELVRAWQHRVVNFCLRMTGSPADAEDIAQDVFVALYRALPLFRGDASLATWIFRIARNRCLNHRRSQGRRHATAHTCLDDADESAFDPQFVPEPPAADEMLMRAEVRQRVQDALLALPGDHRTVIILRDLEGMAYEDIATVTGLALGTVKSRLNRARAALARALQAGPEGGNEP